MSDQPHEENVSISQDAVSGAFGMGMDYFMSNEEEKKEIIANQSKLEKDEWETVSDTMVQIAQERLVGIEDLRSAGLTRSISLATQVDIWQKISEFTEADVTMDGEVDSREDDVTYTPTGVPVPITHKNFRVSERNLQSSRRMNDSLRTDGVAAATRRVSEMLEYLLFNGWTPSVSDADGDSFTMYGYLTHPDRNIVGGSDWSNAGPGESNAGNIRETLVAMINALDADNYSGGGYWLYIAPPQWREFRSTVEVNGQGNRTARARFLDEFDQEIAMVSRAGKLPDGTAVMVSPQADVVELAVAEDISTIEWQSGSGMTNMYKVMAAMAPEIKSDANGNSGVVTTNGI